MSSVPPCLPIHDDIYQYFLQLRRRASAKDIITQSYGATPTYNSTLTKVISVKVDDPVVFFPTAIDMMKGKVEKLEDDHQQTKQEEEVEEKASKKCEVLEVMFKDELLSVSSERRATEHRHHCRLKPALLQY